MMEPVANPASKYLVKNEKEEQNDENANAFNSKIILRCCDGNVRLAFNFNLIWNLFIKIG